MALGLEQMLPMLLKKNSQEIGGKARIEYFEKCIYTIIMARALDKVLAEIQAGNVPSSVDVDLKITLGDIRLPLTGEGSSGLEGLLPSGLGPDALPTLVATEATDGDLARAALQQIGGLTLPCI